MKRIGLLIVLLSNMVSNSLGDIVSKDSEFESPDKSFLASLSYQPRECFIKIVNKIDNTVQQAGPILTPIFSISWSPDSKTIVIIQHIAGGSVPGVAHLTDGKWTFSTAFLPLQGPTHYSVTEVNFVHNDLQFIYKVAATKLNGGITGYYLTGFDLDPSTFTKKNIWKKTIDLDTFESTQAIDAH